MGDELIRIASAITGKAYKPESDMTDEASCIVCRKRKWPTTRRTVEEEINFHYELQHEGE